MDDDQPDSRTLASPFVKPSQLPTRPTPAACRRNPFGPQPLPSALRPRWPAQPMQDHITCALKQARDVWAHYLGQYLRNEPGEVCVPWRPLCEATEFAMLALPDQLSRETIMSIADGLAIAAFYEELRVQTGDRLEDFSVSRKPYPWCQDNVPFLGLPTLDPARLAVWYSAHDLALTKWYAVLPRDLPPAEYYAYRFYRAREIILHEGATALAPPFSPTEAADIAWTAVNAAFYTVVAALDLHGLA